MSDKAKRTYPDGSPKGAFRVWYTRNGKPYWDDMPPSAKTADQARRVCLALCAEIGWTVTVTRVEAIN